MRMDIYGRVYTYMVGRWIYIYGRRIYIYGRRIYIYGKVYIYKV